VRRGASDPVCGMKVERARAISKRVGDQTFYFCSEHCLHAFEADAAGFMTTHAGVETLGAQARR